MFISILLVTGCEEKLYTYDKVVKDSNNKIANDLVIEKPDNLDRSKTFFTYTAYLKRDKDNYLNIIDKYIRYLNDDNIYLNETGINRYDIYCKNGGQYYKD
jgi:hypothetical protein